MDEKRFMLGQALKVKVICRRNPHYTQDGNREMVTVIECASLIDQLGRAAEGAAADKDLSAGMLKDLRSKANDLSSAAAKDRRQLSKARVVDSEEVARLRGEMERKNNNKAVRAAAREKKMHGTAKKTGAGNQVKGEEN